MLILSDPEIIKQVTVKDFDHFIDHRSLFPSADEVNDPPLFSRSLIGLKGQKWRNMRSTLSPAFTGSKMRQIFQLIVECGEEMVKCIKAEAEKKKKYVPEIKDLFNRFTNDVIATSAFGIKVFIKCTLATRLFFHNL